MTVTLHLGAHKTGTTLVQRFARQSSLLAEHDVALVGRSMFGATAPAEPDVAASRNDVVERIRSAYAGGAAGVFMSDERYLGRPCVDGTPGLYPTASHSVAAAAEWLAGFDLRVIYYVRPYTAFLESYFVQVVQEGETHSFDAWLGALELETLRWPGVIEAIRTAAPAADVVVREFDMEIAGGRDRFLRRFFTLIDPGFADEPLSRFGLEVRDNRSLGDVGLKLALAANTIEMPDDKRRALRLFLQSTFSNAEFPKPKLMSTAHRRALDALYERDRAVLGLASAAHAG